jgi:hypothetical protein
LAKRLVGVMTEDPLGAGVPYADDAIAVCRHHGIGGGRENCIGNKPGHIDSGLPCCQGCLHGPGRMPPQTARPGLSMAELKLGGTSCSEDGWRLLSLSLQSTFSDHLASESPERHLAIG